jgi:hypothetical protein
LLHRLFLHEIQYPKSTRAPFAFFRCVHYLFLPDYAISFAWDQHVRNEAGLKGEPQAHLSSRPQVLGALIALRGCAVRLCSDDTQAGRA